jgi:tRNA-binding protein
MLVSKPIITFEEFQLLDIRIGTIISVLDFSRANKPAYKLVIDFGGLGSKQSSAQITQLYSKEMLLERQVLAVVNVSPRQIANFMSEVLVLGVLNADNTVVLLQPQSAIVNGTKVKYSLVQSSVLRTHDFRNQSIAFRVKQLP